MSERLQRANAEIQKAISEIINNSLKDPRISKLITVTSVNVSKDFKHAKVYVSVMSDEESKRVETFKLLKGSASFVRSLLIRKIALPAAPKLDFILDEGHIHTERINKILEGISIPELDEEEGE